MPGERLTYLLEAYAADRASVEEVRELFERLRQPGGQEILRRFIVERSGQDAPSGFAGQDWDTIWTVIQEATVQPRKARLLSMARVRVAAAIVLLAITGGTAWWLLRKEKMPASMPLAAKTYRNDVAPGGNNAILTLANGSTIVLNQAQNGLLAQQGNTRVVKTGNGSLAYSAQNKGSELLYNTIATPRGGQYQMVLPDGSKVWLNAASSLHFPTAFAGNERVVELTGEGYFEVAHVVSPATGKRIPFHVKVNGMDVEVLGTHFNIMAYSNEQNIRTTLLEGKVNVTQSGVTQKLEPGRQAIVDNSSHAIAVAEVNTDQVVAWKNGYFRFKVTGIRELMRQVERWYDVDVEYRTTGADQDFTGIVPRSQNVSALLHTLETTGTVHFRVEGRKILVLP